MAAKEGRVDFNIGFDYSFVDGSRMPLPDPSESGQDTIILPKIGIAIPLFRKKYRAMVAEASKKVSASNYEKANRINELRSIFEKGYKNYRDGLRRVTLYQEQSRIAGQALDLLLAEYSTDGSGFEEVLRMERRLLSYDLAPRPSSVRSKCRRCLHRLSPRKVIPKLSDSRQQSAPSPCVPALLKSLAVPAGPPTFFISTVITRLWRISLTISAQFR